jgi:hypothetical protein
MPGIRLKKSEEPSSPPSNRVEMWYDIGAEKFKYKKETGISYDFVSSKELDDFKETISVPSISFKKNVFQLTDTDINNGFVILTHKALDGSVFASMDRLVVIEGIDFIISTTTDNRSKITFSGELTNNGNECLSAEMVFFVQFAVQ